MLTGVTRSIFETRETLDGENHIFKTWCKIESNYISKTVPLQSYNFLSEELDLLFQLDLGLRLGRIRVFLHPLRDSQSRLYPENWG
jgi:hypothetical protein